MRLAAGPAATDDRHVRQIDREAATGLDRGDHLRRLIGPDLPRAAAVLAVEVAVLALGQDVELLPSVGAVGMTDEAELLEDVERPVHGRGDGPGVQRPAALDEIRAGDMAVGRRKDLDEGPPLRRPAQATGA